VLLIALFASTYTLLENSWAFISYINLIFHEAGHTIFFSAPRFFSVLMGSGMELFIPVFLTWYFLDKDKLLGTLFCLWWSGTALVSIGIYAGDAVVRQLPLLGREAVIHDWAYMLGRLDWFAHAETIGNLFYYSGVGVMGVALTLLTLHLTEVYYIQNPKPLEGDIPNEKESESKESPETQVEEIPETSEEINKKEGR